VGKNALSVTSTLLSTFDFATMPLDRIEVSDFKSYRSSIYATEKQKYVLIRSYFIF
jgi:hypothetical protein